MTTKASPASIPAVNFHLWQPCNMGCSFCYASFLDVKKSVLPKGHLNREDAIKVTTALCESGFQKITFVGGEPTLCPWLPELVSLAKANGLTTMVVTNGTRLSPEYLQSFKGNLDWLCLSIDSLNEISNTRAGRKKKSGRAYGEQDYRALVTLIHDHGFKLKINTVVHALNWEESMVDFIEWARPSRWKIFQVLPIEGQNDGKVEPLLIKEEQFGSFVRRNTGDCVKPVVESNDDMKGSYVMVDPAGRFYDNTKDKHHYSRPILEVGVRHAIQDVNYNLEKFVRRGGMYNWGNEKPIASKITLSGGVGSGKTTIGRLLAERLKYEFVSIGNKTREFAEAKGMSIVDFQRYCLDHPETDKQLDQEFAAECNGAERLVIDYRLGFLFIDRAFHVFLKVSAATAIERLKAANRPAESFHTVSKRNQTFRKQFLNAYGVDYTYESHYDLVVDVEKFESPEDIVGFIMQKVIVS